MRIAIDAHMVGEQETGNETYTLNLVRALLAHQAGRRGSLGYILYTTHPERLRPHLNPDAMAAIRRIRPATALFRIPFAMPIAAARDQADLLHVTYVAPPVAPCPHVVTVHDISYELFPAYFSVRDRWMLRTLVPLSLRRAARVITISEHSRREIVCRYRLPPERVAVTYLAAGEQYQPVTDAAALAHVRARYGLQERYLLALGNLQPRKNLIRLVDAYVRARTQGHLAGVQLVLAGKAQWGESELFSRVRQSGFAEDICFPGYVDDIDLPALYSAALAFVYPSLYEGFGLPPLEAMACGAPVICSHAASLPEVVGDAALIVDPGSVEGLAAALVEVTEQPALRDALRAKGLHRVARFSWQRCAEETAMIYRDVLES